MSVNMNVPFLDLKTPHLELEAELTAIFHESLRTAGFIGGPMVEQFEQGFARFCQAEYAAGVGSGTDALRFALIASGVKNGDVVVTVPNTFIATTEAISQAGALPEFVDVEESTQNMDPQKLQEYLETLCFVDSSGSLISNRSRRPVTAVVPVHLYGQPADMDPIMDLAERYRLMLIEDACQAHGAEYFSRKHGRWMRAGTIGRAAAFSFYPGKNLGACGEAGAVTTNEEALALQIKMLRDHGQAKKYYHDVEGYNGRLDAIQAGILSAKLCHLEKWNAQRREHAAEYHRLFSSADSSVVIPREASWSRGVYHLFVVQTDHRDRLAAHLNSNGIGTGIHYPIPLHQQKAYACLRYKTGDFPVSERLSKRILSLPMYPQLTPEQQARVVEEVLRFTHGSAIPEPASKEFAKFAATARVA